MNAHQKIIKDNARTILKIIAQQYNCKYSAALCQLAMAHPDFPSFLSLQYILHRLGKDSFAMHVTYEELQNLPVPVPFIAHVTTNIELFLFVKEVNSDNIKIIDEKGRSEIISKKDFEIMWDGNVLLIDDSQGKIKMSFKEKFDAFVINARNPFLIFCLSLLLTYMLIIKGEWNARFYLYLLGVTGGLIASILLFIEQTDKHNMQIKKLCSGNKNNTKVDCSSILDFKDAYFLGIIPWSDIGFVYFMFLFIIMLLLPFSVSKTIINVFSAFSMGYVCYSLYYQKYIAKKWCTLCLSVQVVFIFMFALCICTLDFKEIKNSITIQRIIESTIIALSILSLYMAIKSLIAAKRKGSILHRKFNELIFDNNITQYLLSKETELNDWSKVDKLNIGNPESITSLFLVFSPICVTCIKELQILLPILERKKDIRLELIFLLDKEKHPESLEITKWLIQKYNNDADRFSTILLNYVTQYPVSKNEILRDLKILQEDISIADLIENQEKWCLKQKIYSTPILFVNKHKFPDYYNVRDIDYLYF